MVEPNISSNGVANAQSGADDLLTLVYNELRKLAAARMADEWGTQTLQPTALVNEAWLRLGGPDQPAWKNKAHFFGAASEAMRRILVDRARQKRSHKRGPHPLRLDFDRLSVAADADEDSLLAVNEALEKLAGIDSQAAELVKLRFFIGLDYVEAAAALGIAERTAKRVWTYARAWLFKELRRSGWSR
jgi:RNA polymerase sigma factor (TIGR02999 family)